MSLIETKGVYLVHTDLGPVIVESSIVKRFDMEDIIRNRAISQAQAVQFLSLGKQASPNDVTGARTLKSKYAQSDEELPE